MLPSVAVPNKRLVLTRLLFWSQEARSMKMFLGYLIGFLVALAILTYWLGGVLDALQTGLGQ